MTDNGTSTKPALRLKKRKGPLLTRAEYLLYRAAASLARRASDQAVLRWGARLGHLAAVLLARRQRTATTNLRVVFPDRSEEERRILARQCWEHFGQATIDYLRLQSLPLEEIQKRVDIVGRHHLDEAHAAGRGVLLITAHHGSWEVGMQLLMSLGYDLTAVARPLDNELLEKELTQTRRRSGVEMIDKKSAARALVRALDRKGVVMLLPDQAVSSREGLLVPFLGRPAWTTSAPAKLALRFASPIVFVFSLPAGTRHQLVFERGIRVEELPENDRSAEKVTAMINENIGRRILEQPQLWLWMHDRWKAT